MKSRRLRLHCTFTATSGKVPPWPTAPAPCTEPAPSNVQRHCSPLSA